MKLLKGSPLSHWGERQREGGKLTLPLSLTLPPMGEGIFREIFTRPVTLFFLKVAEDRMSAGARKSHADGRPPEKF